MRLLYFFVLVALAIQSFAQENYDNLKCLRFSEPSPLFTGQFDQFGPQTTYFRAHNQIVHRFPNTRLPTEINSCNAVYMFYFGRHTIRYPMEKEVRQFVTVLPKIQQELLSGGLLDKSLANELKQWKLFMHLSQSARVTLSGKLDTTLAVCRWFLNFPTVLNLKETNFEIGHTSKPRTKETAEAFARALIELQISRDGSSFEETNLQIEEILKEKFPMKQADHIVMSHEQCKKRKTPEEKEQEKREYNQLIQSDPIQFLVAQFAQRNGLNKSNANFETISLIYKICANELAILNHSPWCHLFTVNELKGITYVNDVLEYRKSHNADSRVSCTVIQNLYEKVTSIVQANDSFPTKATLYFSHKGLLSRFVTFTNLFQKFPNSTVSHEDLCIPTNRQWSSSLWLPYGANFAVILYRCDAKYKLLTLYNEVPVKLPGCENEFCDLEQFMTRYKEMPCDVEQICPKNK